MEGIWIVLIFLGIGVVIFLISLAYERKRTEDWRAAADELGIDFLGDANTVLAEYGHLKIFQQGRSRKVKNAIVGDSGDVRMVLGDFRYRTGGGKNSSTHHRTFCVLSSARLNVTHCYLRPETRFFDDIGSLLGGQDIDFEDDPGFSKAFVLQGESELAVRELFNQDVRAWFTSHPGRSFYFEADRDALIFHTGKRRPPVQAREVMQQALEILNLLADAGKPR